ncbi:hypothetical protein QQZ08_008521 [Neonectria magnoliae]|uniref:Uncharacterized protein n=1 Tax=Neonectria magnoliae TaxID=2732573 RepID=A0ABR1HVC4_9HYPO
MEQEALRKDLDGSNDRARTAEQLLADMESRLVQTCQELVTKTSETVTAVNRVTQDLEASQLQATEAQLGIGTLESVKDMVQTALANVQDQLKSSE